MHCKRVRRLISCTVTCLLKFGLGLAVVMLECGAALHRLYSMCGLLDHSKKVNKLMCPNLCNAAPHASITTAKPKPNFNKQERYSLSKPHGFGIEYCACKQKSAAAELQYCGLSTRTLQVSL